MYRIEIEASLSDIEISDLTNIIALALGNSDLQNIKIQRISVEEFD